MSLSTLATLVYNKLNGRAPYRHAYRVYTTKVP